MKLVLGITGASGAPYAAAMVRWLAGPGRDAGIEAHLVFTKTGRLVWQHEVGTDPREHDLPIWGPLELTAPFASGSARFDAMAVLPCSAGSLARIANGISADLVGRAADVMLKERRRLVLCVREAPYSLVHLRNMQQVCEAGAVILPASPSFYGKPENIEALVDNVVGRVLDQLAVDNDLAHRWTGMKP
ncbi:MAG TPA: UbiX family flavin prenyltransferase [Myxococcota bacterium]|nr:UbiX family flavin prenyltransferase [Myxococcota bacterium]